MERRDVIKHGLTGLVGLGAGFTLVNQSTTNASAAVSLNGLSISDASKTTENGTVSNIRVTVSGDWDYELPAGPSPNNWIVSLSVKKDGTTETVAETSGQALYLDFDGKWSLEGSVTKTDLYDPSDFETANGETNTVDLTFVVDFVVTSNDGDTLAHSELEDTATVKVMNDENQASEYGTISGNGELIIDE